jgi:hypothetical protein
VEGNMICSGACVCRIGVGRTAAKGVCNMPGIQEYAQ